MNTIFKGLPNENFLTMPVLAFKCQAQYFKALA